MFSRIRLTRALNKKQDNKQLPIQTLMTAQPNLCVNWKISGNLVYFSKHLKDMEYVEIRAVFKV